MKKLSSATASAALLVLGTVGTAPAQAALIQFDFSGTLLSVFNDPSNQLGSVRAGDAVTGNFTINDQIPNVLAGQPCLGPVQGCGLYPGAINDFNFQVGTFAFDLSDLATVVTREALLLNNFLPPSPPGDQFSVIIDEDERAIDQARLIRLIATDPSANALNSVALGGLGLSGFTNLPTNFLFYQDSRPGSDPLNFTADNIRIEAVPVPSNGTDLLALAALGGIIFGRRLRTRVAYSNCDRVATDASRNSLVSTQNKRGV